MIGGCLVPMVADGSVFGPNVDIHLKMLDITPCLPKLKCTELELQDCASKVLLSTSSFDDPNQAFADCDLVIFVGGFPRKDGMERKELLAKNGEIFVAQGKALEKVGKRNVKSVVVANPANTNCLILQKNAPSIPVQNFTCLTRLDQNRGYAQIAERAKVQVKDVAGVVIWGNHSSTQYPDVNNATIKGKPVRQVLS